MARRILAGSRPGARTLVVAGNAHTPVSPIELGVPMGARLAGQRPGIREIRISYGAGSSWNFRPRKFTRPADPHGAIRLHQRDSKLVLSPWRPRRSSHSDHTHDPPPQAQIT